MKSSAYGLSCRAARAGLRSMISSGVISSEWPRRLIESNFPVSDLDVERHVKDCPKCAAEFELIELERVVLDASAAAPVEAGPEFFAALRARIQREADGPAAGRYNMEDAWANLVWVTARQLVPTMAILLILIVGATLIWGRNDAPQGTASGTAMMLRPSERVLFHDIYDTPQPTTDDVLETLVAVEDKDNGK